MTHKPRAMPFGPARRRIPTRAERGAYSLAKEAKLYLSETIGPEVDGVPHVLYDAANELNLAVSELQKGHIHDAKLHAETAKEDLEEYLLLRGLECIREEHGDPPAVVGWKFYKRFAQPVFTALELLDTLDVATPARDRLDLHAWINRRWEPLRWQVRERVAQYRVVIQELEDNTQLGEPKVEKEWWDNYEAEVAEELTHARSAGSGELLEPARKRARPGTDGVVAEDD
jgi:hypothetical protein